MTANELADLIENEDTLWLEPHLNTIATMLRQQQAEIEKLKLQLEYMFKQEIKNAEVIK